jgi:chemotaxis response regulator CheB
MVRLQVVWRLIGPDGQEIGSIKQANPVPAEVVNKQFPALAVAIAEGGADGLVALLSQLPQDRFR